MTSDELEARFISAIDVVRRDVDYRVGHHSFAVFTESPDGYPGIEQAFEDAVRIATNFWGNPSKIAHGPSSFYADLLGVPRDLVNSRALRYAFWSTPEVLASIAMLTHDADTLRSFELAMQTGRP